MLEIRPSPRGPWASGRPCPILTGTRPGVLARPSGTGVRASYAETRRWRKGAALLGIAELVVLAFVVYLVLGPERLPEAARFLGRLVGEVRAIATALMTDVSAPVRQGLQESRESLPEPPAPPDAVPAVPWHAREVNDETEEETDARGR